MTEQQKPSDTTPATEEKEGAWAGKRDAIQPEEQTDSPQVPAQSPAAHAQDTLPKDHDSGAKRLN